MASLSTMIFPEIIRQLLNSTSYDGKEAIMSYLGSLKELPKTLVIPIHISKSDYITLKPMEGCRYINLKLNPDTKGCINKRVNLITKQDFNDYPIDYTDLIERDIVLTLVGGGYYIENTDSLTYNVSYLSPDDHISLEDL